MVSLQRLTLLSYDSLARIRRHVLGYGQTERHQEPYSPTCLLRRFKPGKTVCRRLAIRAYLPMYSPAIV